MGPGAESDVSHGVEPPRFCPGRDSLAWRKSVAQWIDLIATAAQEGDKTYKTVFATLGRQLYNKLPHAQRSIVEEAQEKGTIDFKQADQVKAAREIVDLVATEPQIAIVTRLIDSFNKVTNCRKKRGENLSTFVSRFRGLAAEHLMHASVSTSSQIGEVLAITLLNNAALSEGMLVNAKLQLISLAESRKKEMIDVVNVGSTTTTAEFTRVIESMEAVKESLRSVVGSDKEGTTMTPGTKEAIKDAAKEIASSTYQLKNSLNKTTTSTEDSLSGILRHISSAGRRCPLLLDDAVNVMRSLAHTSSDKEQTLSMAHVESMVNERVQQALLSYGQSVHGNQGSKTPGSAGPSFPSGSISKASSARSNWKKNKGKQGSRAKSSRTVSDLVGEDTLCFDCGRTGHKRGDVECPSPSFLTKKIRREREAQGSSTNTKAPSQPGFFRPGSGQNNN